MTTTKKVFSIGAAILLIGPAIFMALNAPAKVNANGLIDGQRVQGDLNGVLTSSGENSQVTVSGSLPGETSVCL